MWCFTHDYHHYDSYEGSVSISTLLDASLRAEGSLFIDNQSPKYDSIKYF